MIILAWPWSNNWGFYILTHRQQAEGKTLGFVWALDTSKATPSGLPPTTRTHLLLLPKQLHLLVTVPIYKPMGDILIQITTVTKWKSQKQHILFLKTRSHDAQAVFKLIQTPPCECWDYRCVPPCLICVCVFSQAWQVLYHWTTCPSLDVYFN